MESTFSQHEALRARWQSAPTPASGSALQRANEVWPRLPFSEHARQALVATWDHLDVIRLVVDARRTFPTGINGVLRGAIVASSLALWLLGPDDADERDERGLALGDEWYARRIRYQHDLLALQPEPDGHGQAQLALLRQDREQLRAVRRSAVEVQATSVIDWACRHRFGKDSPQHKQALLEWQRLGGDAHALGWQLMVQNVAWQGEPGQAGPQEAYVTGSISNVAEPYLCAWHLLTAGIARFDVLGAPELAGPASAG